MKLSVFHGKPYIEGKGLFFKENIWVKCEAVFFFIFTLDPKKTKKRNHLIFFYSSYEYKKVKLEALATLMI